MIRGKIKTYTKYILISFISYNGLVVKQWKRKHIEEFNVVISQNQHISFTEKQNIIWEFQTEEATPLKFCLISNIWHGKQV